MAKRLTVMKMLRKRLRDEKSFIGSIHVYNDLVNVYGGVEVSDQSIINAINDIRQLNYIIEKLKEYQQTVPALLKR